MDASPNATRLRVVWDTQREEAAPPVSADSSAPRRPSRFWVRGVLFPLVLPLVLLAGLTLCVRVCDLDLQASRLFYVAGQTDFPAVEQQPWLFLYDYGTIPGLVLGIGALTVVMLSHFDRRLRPHRRACLFLALMLAVGPGLLVNVLFKPNWDRPRPCELVEFGGQEKFVPVLTLDTRGVHMSKSFPSGHASMGFYLMAPAFLLYRRNWRWSLAFLLLGLVLGGAIGLGRVVQGRHFPSDILWAAAMVYFPGLLLWYGFVWAERVAQLRQAAASDDAGPAAIVRMPASRPRQVIGPDRTADADREAERRAA